MVNKFDGQRKIIDFFFFSKSFTTKPKKVLWTDSANVTYLFIHFEWIVQVQILTVGPYFVFNNSAMESYVVHLQLLRNKFFLGKKELTWTYQNLIEGKSENYVQDKCDVPGCMSLKRVSLVVPVVRVRRVHLPKHRRWHSSFM